MFNKEFKEEYLRNSKYKTVASSFFKKSKNLESSLNKDVCTFDVHEFRKVLSDVNIKSSNSVRSFRNFIHEYIEWCSGFGINVNYEIAKVDVDTSGSILTSMVSSPAHLKHVLDDIFDRPDEITSDLINR